MVTRVGEINRGQEAMIPGEVPVVERDVAGGLLGASPSHRWSGCRRPAPSGGPFGKTSASALSVFLSLRPAHAFLPCRGVASGRWLVGVGSGKTSVAALSVSLSLRPAPALPIPGGRLPALPPWPCRAQQGPPGRPNRGLPCTNQQAECLVAVPGNVLSHSTISNPIPSPNRAPTRSATAARSTLRPNSCSIDVTSPSTIPQGTMF